MVHGVAQTLQLSTHAMAFLSASIRIHPRAVLCILFLGSTAATRGRML
jgi:hypothetical protein